MHQTVSAIVATSLDGRIALSSSHLSTEWTSKEDGAFLHDMLDQSDAIVLGNNTYQTAIEPLSKRNCIVFTSRVEGVEKKHERLTYVNANAMDMRTVLQPYTRVAVLGGTQVYTYFLEHDLLTDIHLTIEPVLFGRGLTIFDSASFPGSRYALESVRKLNESGTVLLHYTKA